MKQINMKKWLSEHQFIEYIIYVVIPFIIVMYGLVLIDLILSNK